jgi:regulator of sigma E protease
MELISVIISSLNTILVFLIIFGILIILHEFGHFWMARLAKVKILEFGFGLPPKIWGKKTSRINKMENGKEEKETMEWTLNAIPFGGFVRMYGENEESTHPNAFSNRPLFLRMLVICGGVIMNFLLGWFLISSLFFVGMTPNPSSQEEYNTYIKNGYITEKEATYVLNENKKYPNIKINDIIKYEKDNLIIERFNKKTKEFEIINNTNLEKKGFEYAKLKITHINKGSIAEKFDLQKGDIIISINNKQVSKEYSSISFIIDEIKKSKNNVLNISVERENKIINKNIKFTEESNLGIGFQYLVDKNSDKIFIVKKIHPFILKDESYPLLISIDKGLDYSLVFINKTFSVLKTLVHDMTSKLDIPEEIGGPIAIAHHTDKILEYGDFKNLVIFTAILSLSLAVLNIMPFPGLDGGRFVFLLIEFLLIIIYYITNKILKLELKIPKKVPHSLESWINGIGFIILIILLFWITGNDIMKLLF